MVIKHKNRFRFSLRTSLAIIAVVAVITTLSLCFQNQSTSTSAVTYSAYCVSQACRAAADKEAESNANAASLRAQANSLDSEISALWAEISAIEAEIASDQATVDDLTAQIATNQAKLEQQQAALSKLLVSDHISKSTAVTTTTISALAGSTSLSDFMEKKSRQDSAEEQITASLKTINDLKTELEKQKLAAEELLNQQVARRDESIAKQNQITSLQATYANNAAAYAADAEEARAAKEAEIEKYLEEYRRSLGGATTTVDPGLDSYPYAGDCPGINWRYSSRGYKSEYGGYLCECVSYAGWKAREYWGYNIYSWGDANNWPSRARSAGLTVWTYDQTHAAGYDVTHTVAQYSSWSWGHVVWVERDNGDGTINYSEYNGNRTAQFTYVMGAKASKFSSYIRFDM